MPEAGDTAQPRPRVLLVTRNLPPLVGGMERLNAHVAEELARDFEVNIVGPEGAAAHIRGASRVEMVPVRPLWRFLLFALWRALATAKHEKPALVVAGSGLVAPITWLAARMVGAKCLVYLHGLDMVAPSAIYRALWLPMIRRHDRCLVNSAYSLQLARDVRVPAGKLRVLNPGVDPPTSGTSTAAEALRQRFGLQQRHVLLYVGRLTGRKGLLEFVDQAMPALVQQNAALHLLVVGDEAKDALTESGGGYLSRIQEAVNRRRLESSVTFLGGVDDATLAAAYQIADVLVFPAIQRRGDVEGFGMVAIEAAAQGVPTVAFRVGGIPDAVAEGLSGTLVDPGDYQGFVAAVHQVAAEYQMPERKQGCRQHAARFHWDIFGEQLCRLARDTMAGTAD